MQRLCSKVRPLASKSISPSSCTRRLLHTCSPSQFQQLRFEDRFGFSKWSLSNSLLTSPLHPPFASPPSSLCVMQVRNVSSRDRRKKRRPMTPVTSKVKKVKMKFYSSYKSRFRVLNDGTIRRWREGKNHNAHLKSKKSRRRLRQPSTVPLAYAKVMKKLNFCD